MAYSFASASSQSITSASTPATAMPLTMAAIAKSSSAAIQVFVAEGTLANCLLAQNYPSAENLLLQVSSNDTVATANRPSNTYFHMAAVIASATLRSVYMNGGNKASSTTSATPTLSGLYIGKRSNNIYYLNGQLAEIAIWSADLNDDEVTSLSKGFKPTRIRPQSLVFYAPLIRNIQDVKAGVTLTNNNTATVADHPRVY